MQISVKLFGALRQYLPAGSSYNACKLTIAEGSTIADVLALLPIPESKAYLVLFNDTKINSDTYADTSVSAADEIVLLPPIKGG